MRTTMTAALPTIANIATNQTNVLKNSVPITSSHGLNASGCG